MWNNLPHSKLKSCLALCTQHTPFWTTVWSELTNNLFSLSHQMYMLYVFSCCPILCWIQILTRSYYCGSSDYSWCSNSALVIHLLLLWMIPKAIYAQVLPLLEWIISPGHCNYSDYDAHSELPFNTLVMDGFLSESCSSQGLFFMSSQGVFPLFPPSLTCN